ncbi:MAG: hypothetical protein ACI4BH_08445, partial [Muribaculaceae bacterium]
ILSHSPPHKIWVLTEIPYLDRLESAFGRRYTMKMNVHSDISISVSKEKMADLRKRLANK